MNILIIGGCGAFGTFYGNLFKKNNHNVFIKDISKEETSNHCEKNGFNIFNDNFKEMDIVIISVPNNSAKSVLNSIKHKVANNTLIIDFCSVKSDIVKSLSSLKNKKIELASIHPMHGPRVNSISGQAIIFIPIKTGEKYDKLKIFFEEQKANIVITTAKEHDSILSLVQGLTHYSQFVSAATIKELGIELKKAKQFSSPNFELFISLMSRIILQNPELYAEIQLANRDNKKMRSIFTKQSKKFEAFSKKKSSKALAQNIIKTAKIFDSAEEIIFESDMAVNALKFVESTLKKNLGKKILLENITNHTYHYGNIKSISSREVILEEGKGLHNYLLAKMRLCTKEELFEWKKKHLQEKHLDFSFLAPISADKETIENAFKWIKEAKIIVIDEFKSDKFEKNIKSITIKVSFFEDSSKEQIEEDIIKTILGLGYTKR